ISVYEIQQADFYKSQRTTRYHVPPPANLFQNASNFFKQRLNILAYDSGSVSLPVFGQRRRVIGLCWQAVYP
ncbi:MAG: hypothetical protein ACPH52_04995, partial [Candidatus Puniceispirillaceae bacterium]